MKDIRKLISIKQIKDLKPIENADLIELAQVDGWQAVVKKGQFKVGDSVLYFEIDTFIPETIDQFQFLMNGGLKSLPDPNDSTKVLKGAVIKSCKLRGQLSQGLVMPISDFKGLSVDSSQDDIETYFNALNIIKYEKPITIGSGSGIKGSYPSFTQKTDSERVQNLSDTFLKYAKEKGQWVATEKIDGTSSTFWKDENGELRGASRNYEINLSDESVYSRIAEKYKLKDILKPNDVVKGEIAGIGINGNSLKLGQPDLYVFTWESENDIPDVLKERFVKNYDLPFPETVEEALNQVDDLKSLVNPQVQAEGVVWWDMTGTRYNELGDRPNFKAINNTFLLKK